MNINVNAKQIITRLQYAGFDTFLVGGAVRDIIMGRPPKDWDIVTAAHPEEIKSVCSDMRPICVGEAFGIVTLICNDEVFEIATMRTDGNYSDGRRPDSVQFVTDIRSDLERRDFTMNAIAIDPIKGTMIDPFCGGLDIHDKTICFVGFPEDRIAEDKLRILRAFRFAAQLGFTFEENTFNAICEAIKSDNVFDGISQERITAEFSKILISALNEYGDEMLQYDNVT